MSTTTPSKRICIVDTPEPSEFRAKFVYNFFVADEQVNDTGNTPPDFIETMPAADFNSEFLDSFNFNRFTPRYVKLEWKAIPYGNRPDLADKTSISENIAKIHNEQSFTTDEYTNVFFQDNNLDRKYKFFIDRMLAEQGVTTDGSSPTDLARYINENTTDNVQSSFLTEALTNYDNYGYKFGNVLDEAIDEKRVLTTLNEVSTRTQINNKFLASILNTTSKNLTNIFNANGLDSAIVIQNRARTQNPSTIIEGKDYDFEIYDYVGYRTIDPASFDSTIQVVGYLITKTELVSGGETNKESIIVESAYASSTVDLKVKYGSTYSYTVRAVTLIEIAAEDSERNGVIAVSFLVASRRSQKITVTCTENIAPPPVSDFNIAWDYGRKAVRLTWSFPPNSQRDIKYFEIFRRKTINSPFELIKMYDFNDSLIQIGLPERPDNNLVHRLNSPLNIFIDREFTKDSEYIYAVCSVDAHGISSNYGMQFACSFDRHQNKIIKKLISFSGAPKPYPNFYLQRDAFVDSIKTSGSKRLQVIFNPEYLKVVNRRGSDLKLLNMEENGFYKFQMINVDLQKEQTFNILLKDLRTITERNS